MGRRPGLGLSVRQLRRCFGLSIPPLPFQLFAVLGGGGGGGGKIGVYSGMIEVTTTWVVMYALVCPTVCTPVFLRTPKRTRRSKRRASIHHRSNHSDCDTAYQSWDDGGSQLSKKKQYSVPRKDL